MSPALKYALGRVGLFVLVAAPALVLLPRDMNVQLKLMIAVVVSAGLGLVLLRGVRAEVAEQMSANARRKIEERQRLWAALAGEDEPPAPPAPDRPDRS